MLSFAPKVQDWSFWWFKIFLPGLSQKPSPPFYVFPVVFLSHLLPFFKFIHFPPLNGDRAFFEVDGSLSISGEGTWTEAREGGACCQRVLRLLFACQPKMGEGTWARYWADKREWVKGFFLFMQVERFWKVCRVAEIDVFACLTVMQVGYVGIWIFGFNRILFKKKNINKIR